MKSNHIVEFPKSVSNLTASSAKDMISLAEFEINKSFIDNRNKIGPNTVPCGTQIDISSLILKTIFILTSRVLPFQ